MDAITYLDEQHREVEALFSKLAGGLPPGEQRSTFVQLAELLLVHTELEESNFYRASLSPETDRLLWDATEEHFNIRRQVAVLLELSVDDPQFAPGLASLRKSVEEHVEREEAVVFPLVREALGARGLELLGEVLERDEAKLRIAARSQRNEDGDPSPIPY